MLTLSPDIQSKIAVLRGKGDGWNDKLDWLVELWKQWWEIHDYFQVLPPGATAENLPRLRREKMAEYSALEKEIVEEVMGPLVVVRNELLLPVGVALGFPPPDDFATVANRDAAFGVAHRLRVYVQDVLRVAEKATPQEMPKGGAARKKGAGRPSRSEQERRRMALLVEVSKKMRPRGTVADARNEAAKALRMDPRTAAKLLEESANGPQRPKKK